MWSQIAANKRKSKVLAFFMLILLLCVGYAFMEAMSPVSGAGIAGAFFAFVLWVILLLVSYFSGGKIMLATSGARKIERDDFPVLYNIVEEMKIASGLPAMPEIYIIDDNSPNAFATGRSPEKAAVAVTSGLLTRLSRDELQGVIAHEMGHVVNRDITFMTMIGVMVGVIVLMADIFVRGRFFALSGGRRSSRSSSTGGGQAQLVIFLIALLFMILAPILANIIYFAASRKREYLADACGAQFTRYPEGLASALHKISASPQQLKHANRVTAPMYIVNPLAAAGKMKADGFFSTHPATENRIRILRSMGGAATLASYQKAYSASSAAGPGRMLFSAKDLTSFKSFGDAAPRQATAGAAAAGAAMPAAMPATAPHMQSAAAVPTLPPEPAQQRRDVNDFFWKKEGYGLIDCDCGVRLKFPPKFHARKVQCPKCGKKYKVPAYTGEA